ncbi:MAG: GH3 auxin-responsive promoter family protein [Bacteroidales bacterium]|nr:GH3 auxin-responsive promoter family protein [Bacteroidales bacterium]
MSIVSTIASISLRGHSERVDMYSQYPDESQFQLFGNLLKRAAKTDVGRRYGFGNQYNMGPMEFADMVPLCRYDDVSDVLAEAPRNRSVMDNNELSVRDVIASYLRRNPDSAIFSGKILLMGGKDYFDKMPFWLSGNCIYESENAYKEDVACICGYPSNILVFLRRVLGKSGRQNIHEVWPNLELIVCGGMDVSPYVTAIEDVVSCPKLKIISTLSGPEGFLAFQDNASDGGLLLMLDNGIYYELIPEPELQNADSKAIPLNEAKLGNRYALVISGNGLWRYVCGYIVEFTSLRPHRIRVVDNIYLFSNAFGEKISKNQAAKAMRSACMTTGAEVRDFSAEPEFSDGKSCGRLVWNIDFTLPPNDNDNFVKTLDFELRRLNEVYNDLRFKNIVDEVSLK